MDVMVCHPKLRDLEAAMVWKDVAEVDRKSGTQSELKCGGARAACAPIETPYFWRVRFTPD